MKITQKELENMSAFFRKTLFYSIPYIDIAYNETKNMGQFIVKMADDYIEEFDDVKDEYLYRSNYKEIAPFVGYYTNVDPSWADYENHPKIRIDIAPELSDDLQKLTATLLHELSHYYLWYIGHDHHDNQKQFLDFCKKMDLPTNYRFKWIGNRWVDTYDYSKVDKYIKMYEGRMAA